MASIPSESDENFDEGKNSEVGPTVTVITDNDATAVIHYLRRMDIAQLKRLGVQLGLDIFNVEKMQTWPDDMVRAWLRKEDTVIEKSGYPLSWEALARTLQKFGQKGIANDIRREKCGKNYNGSEIKFSSSLEHTKSDSNGRYTPGIVLIVAIIVGLAGYSATYLFKGLPFTTTTATALTEIASTQTPTWSLNQQKNNDKSSEEFEASQSTEGENLIYIPHQSGEKVVDLCIEKLTSFGSAMLKDNRFMKRIAYVMSDFGRNVNVHGSGGIWQVSYVAYLDTLNTGAHQRLPKKYDKIKSIFGIDWTDVKYEDLDKPFYSALAARLFLSNFPELIPPAHPLEKQAEYWKKYYMGGVANAYTFVDNVRELEQN